MNFGKDAEHITQQHLQQNTTSAEPTEDPAELQTEPSPPAEPNFSGEVTEKHLRIVPWVVAFAFFMQMLDGTILNTALPMMAKSLNVNPLSMQAVVISYLITVALLIPASGWIADRFGTKKTFFCAIIIFCLGSLLCALARDLPMLVGARIVQGIGGAIMVPVGRLALFRIVPRSDLVRVMNFIIIPGLIGPLLGPTLGGFFVQYASWHWIFLINLPVGFIGCILVLRYMPALKVPKKNGFDWSGFLLFGAAMVSISLAVEGMGELNLPRMVCIALLAGGILSLLGYCIYALYAKAPLFRLQIFKVRSFAVGIAGNFFTRLGSGAMPFLMPLLFQLGLGFSPAKAGYTMIPLAVGAILAKPFVTKGVQRFGFRNLLVLNTFLLGIIISSFALIQPDSNYYVLLAHLTIFGIVNSSQFSMMNTSTVFELSQRQASSGNSILSVVMQLSISFGVSAGALLLNYFTGASEMSSLAREELITAFHHTFLGVGVFSIFACLTFSFMPANVGKYKIEGAATPQ